MDTPSLFFAARGFLRLGVDGLVGILSVDKVVKSSYQLFVSHLGTCWHSERLQTCKVVICITSRDLHSER